MQQIETCNFRISKGTLKRSSITGLPLSEDVSQRRGRQRIVQIQQRAREERWESEAVTGWPSQYDEGLTSQSTKRRKGSSERVSPSLSPFSIMGLMQSGKANTNPEELELPVTDDDTKSFGEFNF